VVNSYKGLIVRGSFLMGFGLLLAGASLGGCGPRGESLYSMFQDEDPAVRVRAARQAGEVRDSEAVPYLIDRLTDSAPEVRFFAILALEKITGTRMGYCYHGSSTQREESARRWRDWLIKQREEAAASGSKEETSP
jgi:hypothetical protein